VGGAGVGGAVLPRPSLSPSPHTAVSLSLAKAVWRRLEARSGISHKSTVTWMGDVEVLEGEGEERG